MVFEFQINIFKNKRILCIKCVNYGWIYLFKNKLEKLDKIEKNMRNSKRGEKSIKENIYIYIFSFIYLFLIYLCVPLLFVK